MLGNSRGKSVDPDLLLLIFKMRTVVISILALVTLLSVPEGLHARPNHGDVSHEAREPICEPGSTKREDCNTCFCTNDGYAWGCTMMGCQHFTILVQDPEGAAPAPDQGNTSERSKRDVDDGFRCVPNEHFMNDCNHCYCTPDGRSASCTLMGCPSHYPPGRLYGSGRNTVTRPIKHDNKL